MKGRVTVKTWDDLTEDQQQKATEKVINDLVEDVVTGAIRFDDTANGDSLQQSIDNAIQEAQDNQTPWFAQELVWKARYFPGDGHIVEDDGLWPVSELLQSLATPICEDALYSEDEVILHGIA